MVGRICRLGVRWGGAGPVCLSFLSVHRTSVGRRLCMMESRSGERTREEEGRVGGGGGGFFLRPPCHSSRLCVCTFVYLRWCVVHPRPEITVEHCVFVRVLYAHLTLLFFSPIHSDESTIFGRTCQQRYDVD
jgi:hypothetical protein